MLESEFSAQRAKEAIDVLSRLNPATYGYDSVTPGEMRYLQGYLLYEQARLELAPDSREQFCSWLHRLGYWPE